MGDLRRHIIVILFFFVYILLIAISCNDNDIEQSEVEMEVDSEIQPDQIIWNMEVKFIDSSITKAILKGDRGRVFHSRQQTILDGNIDVEFLSQYTQERVSHLTADSIIIDDNTHNMIAMGNVYVYSDSTDTKLETSVLEWNNAEQKLYSTEFVKIISPKERLQGYGFESDANLSNYRIFKVSGESR